MLNLKSFVLAAFALGAGALALAVSTRASEADDPLSQLLLGGTKVVNESYQRVWTQIESGACARIKARIEQPDALGKGTTAYDTTCTFGGSGTVAFDGSRFTSGALGLSYAVPGNTLDFRTKTPFGRWADPRFHVTYDLGITTHVSTAPAVPPLAVNDAVATASNVKVHGGNLTGSMASLFITPAVNESVDLKSAFSDALAAYWPRATPH